MTVWKDRHTLSQQRVPFNNILIQDQNKFNLLNILTSLYKKKGTLLSQERVPFNNILIQDKNKFNLLNILTSLYKKKGTLLSQERVPLKLIVYKVVEKNRFFRGNFSDGRRFSFFFCL